VENALLVGLSRQMALRRELDVIANNMANVSTTGFKARSARFSEFVMPVAKDDNFLRPDRRLSYVIDQGTPIDPTSGTIERTGNALDAAVKGEGYFVVQTAGGERYTRSGAFDINSKGELVTQQGHRVIGENGPVVLAPGETGVRMAADGTVSTDQGQRGKLRLVKFANPQSIRSEGDNLFSSITPAQPVGPTGQIEPGALERSNVKPILEMSRLLDLQRTYTTIAGLMSKVDELRRTAISRLADQQG
jgi:flagellar basal-body rod protein FlgF